MKLKQLINSLDTGYSCLQSQDFEVKGISCNSKDIKDNFVFIAIKGVQQDGHDFIPEAIKKGAKAIVIQSPIARAKLARGYPGSAVKPAFIRVKDTRKALAKLAAEFYGRPSQKLKVVGITGTNGKTTVAYLIEAILKEAGLNPGVISTVNYRFNNKVVPSRNTTPGPIELEFILADMLNAGVDCAVMEVSSHALDQDRTQDIHFHSAVFTNLTQDHLDYHHTLEDYFQAKSKLFKDINSHSFAVVNRDDEYGCRLLSLLTADTATYGIEKKAEIVAKDIRLDIAHTEFCLKAIGQETDFKTSLIGRHNVYNVLAAVAWALREGLGLNVIKSAVKKFSFVPGRLERIDSDNFAVFVDYAHTEDALENVIGALRQLSKKRIIVVFGCGGERDKNKRPKMGKVVSELADYALITNDNPRSEDPEAIIAGIKRGISKNNYAVIPERCEAIKESLRLAQPGDIVLVAGKGHENYQILNDRVIHFDDREIIRECLRSMIY